MKKIIYLILTALVSFCALAGGNPDAWVNAKMGICITNIIYHANGVEVDFVTDLEPPYRVGIHHPLEVGFAYCRARPIAYIDTNERHAFVPCNLYDCSVFVQVYKANDSKIIPPFWRKMPEEEWLNYVRRMRRAPIKTILNPTQYEEIKDRDITGIDPYNLRIIADHTWSGFIYTNATSISGKICAENQQTEGETEYKTNHEEYSFRITGRDPNVGTGFRIMVFEKPAIGTNMCIQATAAYSAITNMSAEILIKRGFKALSSNGEWKLSCDWEGYPIMIPCTNVVPYRIYGEGL